METRKQSFEQFQQSTNETLEKLTTMLQKIVTDVQAIKERDSVASSGEDSTPMKKASSSGLDSAATVKGTNNGESCSFRKNENDIDNVELVVGDDKECDLLLALGNETVNVVDSLHKDSSNCIAANGATNLDNHCSGNECFETVVASNIMQSERIEIQKSHGNGAEENEIDFSPTAHFSVQPNQTATRTCARITIMELEIPKCFELFSQPRPPENYHLEDKVSSSGVDCYGHG